MPQVALKGLLGPQGGPGSSLWPQGLIDLWMTSRRFTQEHEFVCDDAKLISGQLSGAKLNQGEAKLNARPT